MKFVIHEHHAKRAGLHWDIRLQYKPCKTKDSISLYSFATRKLPQFVNGKQKRIMVFQTPDHECWWLNFEGELTQGYGAGMIYIWDKGTIKWIKDTDNRKIFYLKGNKINGYFALIKTNYDSDIEWLLIRMTKQTKP